MKIQTKFSILEDLLIIHFEKFRVGLVIQVLIKQVNDECGSSDEVELMLKESCAFRALKHKNLNTILGVCFDSAKKPFTLFHFCNLGNLKHYLSGLRTTKCKNSEFLMQLSSQTSFSEHVSKTGRFCFSWT